MSWGFLSWGVFVRGLCPGGFCLGGFVLEPCVGRGGVVPHSSGTVSLSLDWRIVHMAGLVTVASNQILLYYYNSSI